MRIQASCCVLLCMASAAQAQDKLFAYNGGSLLVCMEVKLPVDGTVVGDWPGFIDSTCTAASNSSATTWFLSSLGGGYYKIWNSGPSSSYRYLTAPAGGAGGAFMSSLSSSATQQWVFHFWDGTGCSNNVAVLRNAQTGLCLKSSCTSGTFPNCGAVSLALDTCPSSCGVTPFLFSSAMF